MKHTIFLAVALVALLPSANAQHRTSGMVPPAEQATVEQSAALISDAEVLQAAGNFKAAEKKYLAANALDTWNPAADRGLAEVYTAQGRDAEALRLYRTFVYPRPDRRSTLENEMRTLMPYAALLSKTGHWAEAVAVYHFALPRANFDQAPNLDVGFTPQIPMPAQLEALAHTAVGLESAGHGDNVSAFKEFEQGMRLAPELGLVNYFYGNGWQHLGPAERAKYGDAAQAKAALEKAVKLGKPDVKEAAQRALLVAAKP